MDKGKLKSVVRIVEKAMLRRDAIGCCDGVCDILRAMLVVHSMWQVACTAEYLLRQHERDEIKIVRIMLTLLGTLPRARER